MNTQDYVIKVYSTENILMKFCVFIHTKKLQINYLVLTVVMYDFKAVSYALCSAVHLVENQIACLFRNNVANICCCIACPDGLTQCTLDLSGLPDEPLFERQSCQIVRFQISSAHALSEINFSDRQECLMVFSIVCDL